MRKLRLACAAVQFSARIGLLASVLCALSLAPWPALAACPPAFYVGWGSPGDGPGQFRQPLKVATDASGNVYVTDDVNNRVQKFSSDGVFVRQWGSPGTAPGQFQGVWGIAVAPSGNVYVSDGGRVQVFSSDGVHLNQWGSRGSGPGELSGNSSLAVDDAGHVYVVGGYYRVQKFTSTGQLLAEWETPEFLVDVAVDRSGNIYLATGPSGAGSVRKLSSDGALVAQWYGFLNPQGIGVDFVGNVYIVDTYNHQIQAFTGDGSFLCRWGSFGGNGGSQFNFPTGVAVDHAGNVIVADHNNYRVAKFGDAPVRAPSPTWGRVKTLYR